MTITLRRTSPKGSQYYYTIHDRQAGLFQAYTLITVWGPKPENGREKIYGFDSRREKDAALRKMIAKRIRDGYTVFYSYSRSGRYRKVFQEFKQNEGVSAQLEGSRKSLRTRSG